MPFDTYDLASTLGWYGKILLAISIILAIPVMTSYHPPTRLKCIAPTCYYNNDTGQTNNTYIGMVRYTTYHEGQIIKKTPEEYNKGPAYATITSFILGIIMLLTSIILFVIIDQKKQYETTNLNKEE